MEIKTNNIANKSQCLAQIHNGGGEGQLSTYSGHSPDEER